MTTGFLLFIVSALLCYQVGMRYVLTYRFTDTRVQAVLFRVIPVSSTGYDLVKEVRIISSWEALFWFAVHSENRLTGPLFVLIRRSSFPVLMTPDDPEKFVRQVKLRVYEATGQWLLTS